MRAWMLAGAAVLAGAALMARAPARADDAHVIPAPVLDDAVRDRPQTVVLSGGCFWGVQGVFEHVKGVTRAVAGYAGGAKETAQYETVSTGETGHAESVQVVYDPKQISFGKILQIFFSVTTDPTTLNRQGPDMTGHSTGPDIFATQCGADDGGEGVYRAVGWRACVQRADRDAVWTCCRRFIRRRGIIRISSRIIRLIRIS